MRKLAYLALALPILAACSLETSGNGDLDGYWQLHHLDSLAAGTTADIRDAQVFWAVQVNLLRTYKVKGGAAFFRFENTGDSLRLSDPYIDNRDSSDIKVADPHTLRPFGVNALRETFAIEQLDGDNMTLRSSMLRLYFRKY